MKFFKLSVTRLFVLGVVLAAAIAAGYFLVPDLLVGAAGLLVSDDEPFAADAVVVLAGGGPERSQEAAEIYRDGLAANVVLTTRRPTGGYPELARAGIDLAPPYENDMRILVGLGVPGASIMTLETDAAETLAELGHVRQLAAEAGWDRLIVVTSNYRTRRTGLIARYVFDADWQVAVVGSRYDRFRPDGWWRNAADARAFLIEFQAWLFYEMHLRPRLWFR